MYQYILFDLDGTLTDSKEGIVNCLKYAFEKLGDPIPADEKLLRFIGPPLLASFQEFCGYDAEIGGYGMRKLENLPPDEAVLLMKVACGDEKELL